MRTPLFVAVATLLAPGCSTSAPALAPPARIEFHRANPVFCGQSGSPICEARVNHAEGKPVLTIFPYTDIAPGAHVLGLFCRVNLSIMIGDAQSVQREVEVELAPGARYRLEASMAPAPCTMRLVRESP
jgi:hypothetical protein